jgi:hypothetical protein
VDLITIDYFITFFFVVKVKVKVMFSRYRPKQALDDPEG